MTSVLHNVDLSHPLTDHPIWKDVRGVWIPASNTAGGNKLIDLGPYGNHASQSDSTKMPKWVGSERGIGLEFDGTDDNCSFVYSLANQSWTCFVLFNATYLESSTDKGVLFSSGSVGATRSTYHLRVQSNSVKYGEWGDDLQYYTTMNTDRWYGIATSRDSNNYRSLYIDAVLKANDTAGGAFNGNSNSMIGSWAFNATVGVFSGLISSCVLLTRVLSASEIAFLYEQSLTGYPDLIRRHPTRTFFAPITTSFTACSAIFNRPKLRVRA